MGATTTHLTAVGVVAGTLPYMSPEQLRGEDVDARSDVFAFGALLSEMITGARPFSGGSSVELMASVLERDTPTLPDSESGPRRALDRLIKNCLVKDRAERWQNARDAALQLRGIEQDLAAPAHVPRSTRRAIVAFWVLIVAAAGFAGGYLLRQRPAGDAVQGRYLIDLSPDVTGRVFDPAIAPDGRTLVFNVDARICAHRLDTGERRILGQGPGPDSGFGTSWSTDGRSLLYYSSGVLYSLDLATGARRQVLVLASGPTLHAGVAQNSAGTLLLGGARLRRLDAGGQTARDVYATDATVLANTGRRSCQTAVTSCSRKHPAISSAPGCFSVRSLWHSRFDLPTTSPVRRCRHRAISSSDRTAYWSRSDSTCRRARSAAKRW